MPATAIYLSPHYDDICFSLGMTAKAGAGGHLINVFTQCNYTALPVMPPADIATLRDGEDKAFAEACGLQRHNLGLPEATMLGLSPFDLHDIEQEVAQVEKILLPLISNIFKQAGDAEKELYCPLSVGQHRNHVSVFLSVVKSCALLQKTCRLFFYEDLPYASHSEARKEAILRLHQHYAGVQLLRHANQMDEKEIKEKLKLVSLYPSQHESQPVQKDFIPAEPLAAFPHEAFWEVA